MDDAEVLVAWMHELSTPQPNPTVVASLEADARKRGWNPKVAYLALVAGVFDETLHPRGHDGRFIEIGGLMKIISGDHEGERAKVERIGPDRSGRPIINLRRDNGDLLQVTPNMIEQATDKARLDTVTSKTVKEMAVGDILHRDNSAFPDRPFDYEVIGEPRHVTKAARLDEGYYPIAAQEWDEIPVRDLNTGEETTISEWGEYNPRPERRYKRYWDVRSA